MIFDFDGTITTQDTTDLILDIPNEDQIWRLEEEWKEGKITSYQCMKAQAKYLKGITIEEVREHLKQQSNIDPYFPKLVSYLKTESFLPIVLSEGYDISIRFHDIQKHIEDVYCSKLIANNGKLSGELQVSNERKWKYNDECIGCCICKVDFLCQLSERIEITKSFAIGDGGSDGCLFQYVDVSFSLNPKYQGTYLVKSFYEVLKILKGLK